MNNLFTALLAVFHVAMVVLFATTTEYNPTYNFQRYPTFQDVHIMIFVGFGFLMAFLHRNSLTTTSHSFLVASFVIPWAMLNAGFWHRAIINDADATPWDKIKLGVEQMITADFCAGAILISFGAVVGKCSASQLLVMALIEVVVYHINEAILIYKYKVVDIGGSMVIHAFGAYFGLAASFVLEKMKPERSKISTKLNGSTQASDTLAMIGTLFLWCFWPSFNGALAGTGYGQQRAVLNTFLSLASSCIVTFYACAVLHGGKFRMVEIQNASLAGGVAMGTAADMFTEPYGALLIGAAAGLVSCLGYKYIGPLLETAVGLKDTCGVHNLHGMPGVLGGLIGVIVARQADLAEYGADLAMFGEMANKGRTAHVQANFQLAGVATTLVFSLFGGAVTGAVLSLVPGLEQFFDDNAEFVLEGAEEHDECAADDHDVAVKVVATEPIAEIAP